MMSKFYDTICDYFQLDQRGYSHDIAALIKYIDHLAYSTEKGIDPERVSKDLIEVKLRCTEYEKRQEDNWALISSLFSSLKDKLT